jgi:MFS family permease
LFTFLLLGPVIAPVIGGLLVTAFKWRSIFVFLAAICAPLTLIAAFFVPETQHYRVWKREQSKDSARNFLQAESMQLPPVLLPPWKAALFLFDTQLTLYYLSAAVTFGGLFTSYTVLPLYLSKSPYNLSPSSVGLAFLPCGIGNLVGSTVGGSIADKSFSKYSSVTDGRMVYPQFAGALITLMFFIFGYLIQQEVALAGVLTVHFFIGLLQSVMMPSTLSFMSASRPLNAGAAMSVNMACCFFFAAIMIASSVSIAASIGIGHLFLVVACASLIITVLGIIINLRRVCAAVEPSEVTGPTGDTVTTADTGPTGDFGGNGETIDTGATNAQFSSEQSVSSNDVFG